MKKTDKKIENTLRTTLTKACDIALDNVQGFQWLTHQVNAAKGGYTKLSQSLSITCVFDRNEQLALAISTHQDDFLRSLITEQLASAGIPITNPNRQIILDSEENCDQENGGLWQQRLR